MAQRTLWLNFATRKQIGASGVGRYTLTMRLHKRTLGAMGLVLFGIGMGWLAFGCARPGSPSSEAAASAAPNPVLTAKNVQAIAAARAVLANGIAAHRWDPGFRREFSAALSGATREQRMQLHTELVQRLNDGELEYDPQER